MNPGSLLIIAGILLIVFGLAFRGFLGPLGKLPGDVRIERQNFSFYFPFATSIVLSVILTLILWLFRR